MVTAFQRSLWLWSTFGISSILHVIQVSNTLIRALTHDESIYPNANKFDPERFVLNESKSKLPPDPRNFVFGFGRR